MPLLILNLTREQPIQTPENSSEDTLQLLSYSPDRLGHATFLDASARQKVFSSNAAVEICLSSNLLCKTVKNLDEHHIRHYLECGHPIAICVSSFSLWPRDILELDYRFYPLDR